MRAAHPAHIIILYKLNLIIFGKENKLEAPRYISSSLMLPPPLSFRYLDRRREDRKSELHRNKKHPAPNIRVYVNVIFIYTAVQIFELCQHFRIFCLILMTTVILVYIFRSFNLCSIWTVLAK